MTSPAARGTIALMQTPLAYPPIYAPLGLRLDGTAKGPGFASVTLPEDGSVMTEFSAGAPEMPPNPFGMLYPSVYEGITPWDLATLQNVARYGSDPLEEDVYARAYESALVRASRGLSPFWTEGVDAPTGLNYTPYFQER